MPEKNKPAVGSIAWQDLTVPNADEVKDFYKAVTGWNPQPFNMGEYNDYNMTSPVTGETVAGICNTAGTNVNLPPQWLIYITVENVDRSIDACISLGGKVIDGPKNMGESKYCVIRDPAGAVCALFQP